MSYLRLEGRLLTLEPRPAVRAPYWGTLDPAADADRHEAYDAHRGHRPSQLACWRSRVRRQHRLWAGRFH